MKQLIIFLVFSPAFLGMQCKTEKIDPDPDCPSSVIISEEAYLNAPSDELSVVDATITGNCLEIEFTSSGCDGSTWDIRLIDANAIMESYPVQRNLRLSLQNQEVCDAVITRSISFDISSLQLNYDEILLNLTNSGDQLLYEY